MVVVVVVVVVVMVVVVVVVVPTYSGRGRANLPYRVPLDTFSDTMVCFAVPVFKLCIKSNCHHM